MSAIRVINKVLALLIGIPLLAFLTVAFVMPVYFKATAVPVHADASSVPAQSLPADPRWASAADRADQLSRALAVSDNLPGLSIAVGIDGHLVWTGAYGWADVEARLPVTAHTRFRMGFASIPLTAAGAGLLVESGKLDLDAPVQRYLPDFPQQSPAITTRLAMAHMAGLRNAHIEAACARNGHGDLVTRGLAKFAGGSLRFAPGSDFGFSPYSWILVSAVIESASGMPFVDYMQRNVYTPLGMQHTAPEVAADLMPDLDQAQLYHPRANADHRTGLEHPDPTDFSCFLGAGMYQSTPADLVRFVQAMQSHALLDPDTMALLQTPLTLPSGESTRYGLGWFVGKAQLGGAETRLLGHPGATLGGTTSLRHYPEHGVVVAVMSNLTFAELAPLGEKVAALFVAARSAEAVSAVNP